MLTLSQAMRIGSLIRPQCFGFTRGKIRAGVMGLFMEVDATCAWGAAQEAIGAKPIKVVPVEDLIPFRGIEPAKAGEPVFLVKIPDEWMAIARVHDLCPKCSKEDSVDRLISHLNDDHRWKRQRIADWVENIEARAVASGVREEVVG